EHGAIEDGLVAILHSGRNRFIEQFPAGDRSVVERLRYLQRFLKAGASVLLVTFHHERFANECVHNDINVRSKVRRKPLERAADEFEVCHGVLYADDGESLWRQILTYEGRYDADGQVIRTALKSRLQLLSAS